MGGPDREPRPREARFFKQRLDQLVMPEGLLDGLVPRSETIRRSLRLIDHFLKLDPGRISLAPDDLERWHLAIFGIRSSGVGRFRKDTDPRISFGIEVFDEKEDRLVPLYVQVSPPEEIPERLDRAFARFHAATPERTVGLEEAARAVAELQTTVIAIHPFVDANSRVTNVLTQVALHYLGQPELTWTPKDWELAVAHSYANRPDEKRSIEPLVALIVNRIGRRSSRQA